MDMTILNKGFTVLDSLHELTTADSFVSTFNKTGLGHGEAKLYIGNNIDKLNDFFDDFKRPFNCFVLKKDLLEYLKVMEKEFYSPTQEYRDKKGMLNCYNDILSKLDEEKEVLEFKLEKSNVNFPRIYINVNSEDTASRKIWNIIRDIALPNLTCLSILKLFLNNSIYYYFILDAKMDYKEKLLEDKMDAIENSILQDSSLDKTEKKIIVKSRRGQGEYRIKLLDECIVCPFTFVDNPKLLIASHIKPWHLANNKERIDQYNGFIFTPTYDKLFDQGYISFDEKKKIIISPLLSLENRKRLRLSEDMIVDKLPVINERRKVYLKYHRENILKKL